MADEFDNNPSSESPESKATDDNSEKPSGRPWDDFVPGETTAFDYSPEEFADLSEDALNGLKELVLIASRTDVASRRFEVEQAWEARLFERGYQHLLPRRGGGWSLPGEGTSWGPNATADSSSLYSTNIYGRDKDIIVAAMARETPQITFFPSDPDAPADFRASESANKYKEIYMKNNPMRDILAKIGLYYYTDDRVVLYTRLVLDKQQFGENEDGTPAGREITSVYGKLEGKVPVPVSGQRQMQFVQIYEETDVAVAKAMFPWVAKDIRPGSCGIGEIELDKIARINTKLALLGSYVTGDSLQRDVTIQMTWFRPEMFYDPGLSDSIREELLAAFPDGCLCVFAGQIFAFARNERMDDHIVVSHAMPGVGQNRRALGTNNISIQKRLNSYMDIMDDFFRRTIPRRIYDNDAFDVAALQQQDNSPGGSIPAMSQPGKMLTDLVMIEPTPQPQPSLPEFAKMYFDELPASLTGAVPALFGASTNTDTVGGISIQRDQALGRIGVPWNAAKEAITKAAHQAVLAAATRASVMKDTVANGTSISVDPEDLRGNVVTYPEYDQSFPESWPERELRYTEIVQNAPQNSFYAELLKSPKNMRAIADNIRMADLEIPGEDSVRKQLTELDELKTSAPLDNPAYLQAQQQLAMIEQGMTADKVAGKDIPPEAAQMFQQLQQTVAQMPKLIPSVQVEQDESVNHDVEARTVFSWLNSEEGQRFKYGTADEQAGFQNAYLHWQGHMQMEKKLAPPPVAQPPHISIPFDKMPTDAQTQALAHAGINTSPDKIDQKALINTQHKIAERVVPKTVPESINIHKITRVGKKSSTPPSGVPNGNV